MKPFGSVVAYLWFSCFSEQVEKRCLFAMEMQKCTLVLVGLKRETLVLIDASFVGVGLVLF